jgi:hypothetical protein
MFNAGRRQQRHRGAAGVRIGELNDDWLEVTCTLPLFAANWVHQYESAKCRRDDQDGQQHSQQCRCVPPESASRVDA